MKSQSILYLTELCQSATTGTLLLSEQEQGRQSDGGAFTMAGPAVWNAPLPTEPELSGQWSWFVKFLLFCDFYRKYLWNGSTQRKSALSTTYPPLFGELWSTDKKLIGVNVDPPKWTLFRKLYLGRYGVLSP